MHTEVFPYLANTHCLKTIFVQEPFFRNVAPLPGSVICKRYILPPTRGS